MSTRDKILQNIRQSTSNRDSDLNEFDYRFDKDNLFQKFQKSLEEVAADFRLFSSYKEAKSIINSVFQEYNRCVNTVEDIAIESIDVLKLSSPKDLHPLDLAIINGEFGVAENGAIWINTGELPDRTIPFICENLIVILNSGDMVSNMHEAYQKTNNADYDYGVFITGPSKTADIEQTLVVGAQGPRRMLVLMKKQ